jgi:hypothetical protein
VVEMEIIGQITNISSSLNVFGDNPGIIIVSVDAEVTNIICSYNLFRALCEGKTGHIDIIKIKSVI